MILTEGEIRFILKTLEKQYGFGYSDVPEVGRLQAKLSIMLEMHGKSKTKKLVKP